MYCRKCGVQINDTDTYCYNCGFNQNSGDVNSFTVPVTKLIEKPKFVFKKVWFWVLIVIACISVFLVASKIFEIVNGIDFSKEFNEKNPITYYEKLDEFEDFDEDDFKHYFNFDFNIK